MGQAGTRAKQADADRDVPVLRSGAHQASGGEVVLDQAARRPGEAAAFACHLDQETKDREATKLLETMRGAAA